MNNYYHVGLAEMAGKGLERVSPQPVNVFQLVVGALYVEPCRFPEMWTSASVFCSWT